MNWKQIMESKKCYVTVTALHYVNGVCLPQLVETEKGQFMVENVKKVHPLSPRNDLDAEDRTLVVLKGKDHYLYQKAGRWFMVRSKENEDIIPRYPEEQYGI